MKYVKSNEKNEYFFSSFTDERWETSICEQSLVYLIKKLENLLSL